MKEIGKIDRNIVARYIGMKGNAPEGELIALMDKAEKELKEDVAPAVTYKRFDLEKGEGGIALSGASLILPGRDIEKLLTDCDEAVLMCATLGPKVDARIRKLSAADVAMALVYDATASVAIDNICDSLQAEIAEKLPGYEQTMRFSPGYGDLLLELQESFINVLDTKKRVGVSLTEGGMLTPVKTVTAVVGLRKKTESKIQEKDCESKTTEETGEKRGCGLAITCRECARKNTCSMAVL
ncbi:MAG: methionine synthase [Lachnospiraceae bacterium]|nr:methionine synthase [Lachnospiraceae bacterium]